MRQAKKKMTAPEIGPGSKSLFDLSARRSSILGKDRADDLHNQPRRAAVEEALQQQIPHVYRFARRLCGRADIAEEIVQETMLRAWQRRRQLKDHHALRVWVLRIAANYWRDRMRARSKIPDHIWPADGPLDSRPPTEWVVENQEQLSLALRALDALPERQRTVLHLRACEELSIAEIAEVLGITPDAAKASLSVARKRMRDVMEGSTASIAKNHEPKH